MITGGLKVISDSWDLLQSVDQTSELGSHSSQG
jgi:hypothetical protein